MQSFAMQQLSFFMVSGKEEEVYEQFTGCPMVADPPWY